MKSLNRQKILIGFLVIVLIGAGFYYYSINKNPEITELITTGETSEVGVDVLVLVQKLENTNIDSSIFSTALFSSLRDLSQPYIQEEKFRQDPFAPLQNVGPVQNSSR